MVRQNPEKKPGDKVKEVVSEMNKVYRITLLDNQTHRSIRTVKATKWRFIVISVSSVVVFILLIYCLIAFTPIRSFVPGYSDAYSKRIALENAIKIDSLESEITRWNLYAENLSHVLRGETTVNFDSLVRKGSINYLSDKSAEELARQDSILRETVRKEERFGLDEAQARNLPVEGVHFFTPVKGVVSKAHSLDSPGVDISAPAGSIVSAVLDGYVIYSGWNEEEEYAMVIQHSDNILSIYSSNQRLLKNVGDEVKAGTPVALVGQLTPSTQAHLHFELWQDGKPLDPSRFISF